MPAGRIRIAMTDNIIISEVDGPPDVVKCFIREEDGLEGQSRELVVIGLEYIDVFEGVEQDEARKKLRLRTVGYTVAAFYFKDHTAPNRRFYILLKATGRLDFVNLDYKIVKSLETGIDQVRSEPKFMFQDPLRTALVFNLSCTEIYEISTEDIFCLEETDVKLSYVTSSPIVSIDACINFNDFLDKDVFTLSILTRAHNEAAYKLEACVCVFESKPAKGTKWQRTTNLTFVEEATVPQVLLKSVTNIGHFVFTPWKTYFIKHALSSKQTIDGKTVDKIYQGPGAFGSDNMERIELLQPILADTTLNHLTFTFMTSTAILITCRMNAILSSFEDDTYIWEKALFERLPINGGSSHDHYLAAFFNEKCWILVSPKGHLTVYSVRNEGHSNFVHLGSFLCKSTLYSDLIGNYTKSHLSCGSLHCGQGYLCLKFRSCGDIFASTCMKLLFKSKDSVPRQVYSTRKGIYWADVNNNVYRDSERIDFEINGSFIATKDGTLLKDNTIVTLVPIQRDNECNYAYVTKQGYLRWSFSKVYYRIQNTGVDLTIDNCFLSAISSKGSFLTVLVLNDEITVFDHCNRLKSQKVVFHRLSDLASIFLYEYESTVYIFMSDTEGNLCVMKLATFEIVEEVKICKKKLQFCEVPNSDYFFIYTADTIIFFKPSKIKGRFKIQEVYAPCPISCLIPGEKDGSVVMVTSQGQFYDVLVPGDAGRATLCSKFEKVLKTCLKFITLESSSRYVIVAALPVANPLQDKYSEIYVYDIKQFKNISAFNFSNLNNDIESIKYENAMISDIIAVPMLKRTETLGKRKTSELYKEVIFNSCILVSLNLDSIDDIDSKNMNNLLLFSFDEESGFIEFVFGINTGFSISGLHNYYNGCVLVYGEFVQAYQLNYSVHDNKFSIEQVSNRLNISGITITSSIFFDKRKAKMARKQQNIGTWVYLEEMILLDVRKGVMRFNVIHTTDGNIEKVQLQVQPLNLFERDLINSITDTGKMFTGAAAITFKNIRYLLISYGDQKLTLFSLKLDGEEEIDERVYHVAEQVTTINSVRTTDSRMSTFLGESTFMPLFLVSTLSNGCYVIGILHEESDISLHILSEKKAVFAKRSVQKFLGFLDPQMDDHTVISEI